MANYYLYGIIILVAFAVLPFVLRKREKEVDEAGENAFQNVQIIFDRRKNALQIGAITASVMFVYLVIMGVIIAFGTPHTMRTPLELFYTILLIFGAAILGALIVLPFSAAYNYGSLNFSVSYNFNGMGPGIEDAYKKNYLLLSEEGIQGMLSLKWKQVQSLVYYDVPEVLLTISRRPLWLYNLFGMNTVRLRFTTDGDAQRFRAKLLHYKPSLSIKPAHPTTPEFVV